MDDGADGLDESKRLTLKRFAALGAAGPLASISSDSSSDAHDAIAGYVARNPGTHFSKIRDDLSLGTGETQYHVRRLENAGALESRRDGDYRRFFTAGRFAHHEQVALGYLRRDTPRGMMLALLAEPSLSGAALADRLDVSRATVSTAAGELESAGLLDREDGYDLQDPETLLSLLDQYADSFGDEGVVLAGDADGLVNDQP